MFKICFIVFFIFISSFAFAVQDCSQINNKDERVICYQLNEQITILSLLQIDIQNIINSGITLNFDSAKPQISIIIGALTAIAFAVGSSMRW